MNTDFLLQGHLNDLANKAYQKNIYTFTNFLSASDLDIFYSMLPDISHIPYEIFGGRDGCEYIQQRGLPRAGFPHDCHIFARFDGKRNVRKCLHLIPTKASGIDFL